MAEHRSNRPRAAVWLFAAAMTLGVACGETQETGGGPEPESTTIAVQLKEWSVIPDETLAPAGAVVFDVENTGKKEHEFMVVRTDLDLTGLPAKDDGSLDDEGEGVEIVDATNTEAHGGGAEHATIEPGEQEEFAYGLEAGSYVLLCNLVEAADDEDEVHFKLGMRIPFEVT